jgi:hypothetical protein
MTYWWSHTKTIICLDDCGKLVYNLLEASVIYVYPRARVCNQHILSSYQVISYRGKFADPSIIISMCIFSFVCESMWSFGVKVCGHLCAKVCGHLEWKRIYAFFFLLFVFFIAVFPLEIQVSRGWRLESH